MTTPFKEWMGPEVVQQIADRQLAAWPAFKADAFTATALDGLDALELKARVTHIAQALRAQLPEPWLEAIERVISGLGPALQDTEKLSSGFEYWPLLDLVQRHGVAHPKRSLDALHALTQRFSAEFAVRPYIEQHPALAMARLQQWVSDPNPHVRRLVSEGTRPRLPWGQQLKGFIKDPAPVLALLEQLKDDPERYVQRSVANNLNDIAKDHPDLVVEVARRWSQGAGAGRAWTVKHALRSLVKKGHTGALEVLGYGPPKVSVQGFGVGLSTVVLGGAQQLTAGITSTSAAPQKLVVDYAVHHKKANGSLSPKVFKWTSFELAPGAHRALKKKHNMKPISTRRYHPGLHRVELLINGESMGLLEFEFLME